MEEAKTGRGRRTALLLGLSALAALAAGAYAGRDRILEEWWLWRLRSANDETAVKAAMGLCQLRSRRSVPRILERVTAMPGAADGGACLEWVLHRGSREGLLDALKSPSPEVRSLAAYTLGCLRRRGSDSIPALRDSLDDVDANVRRSVAQAIQEIEGAEGSSADEP